MPDSFTAKEVYDAYPGSDLLSVVPPTEGLSLDEWKNEEVDPYLYPINWIGDTLFVFVVRELSGLEGCGDRTEAVRSLRAAAAKLESVARALDQ